MDLGFEVGPVSLIAVRLLAAATGVYAVLTTYYAWRGVQARLQDRWSAVGCALVLYALAGSLWTVGPAVLPAPFSGFLLLILVGAVAFTGTYTMGRYKERIERFREEAGARLGALLRERVPEERHAHWLRLRERFGVGLEERRKVPHLAMGIVVPSYLFLGHAVLFAAWQTFYGGDAVSGEGARNLFVATHNGFLVGGHVTTLTVLLGILYILAPTELLRLRYPELSYPFKEMILTRLREREKGLFGAHYYIAAASPLAALWVAPDPAQWHTTLYAVVSVMAITVFADTASALVGVRWGKRKWFHHPGKSYLGTVGGTLVAVLLAVPFVGVPVGIASGLVFAVLDILAPVPLPVSDNILNPVGLSILYIAAAPWLDPLIPFY